MQNWSKLGPCSSTTVLRGPNTQFLTEDQSTLTYERRLCASACVHEMSLTESTTKAGRKAQTSNQMIIWAHEGPLGGLTHYTRSKGVIADQHQNGNQVHGAHFVQYSHSCSTARGPPWAPPTPETNWRKLSHPACLGLTCPAIVP
jgi:hypothetical protein